MLSLNFTHYKRLVLNFLKSLGIIRAEILSKLEKAVCPEKSSRLDLYEAIISLVQEKKIDLLIIKPFQIIWEKKHLSNMQYLQDGMYYIRNVNQVEFNHPFLTQNDDFLFDSGIVNDKPNLIWVLRELIEVPQLKDKIIIIDSEQRSLLKIYESMDKIVQAHNKQNKKHLVYKLDSKISVPLDIQELILAGIKSYRKNFMCFYITLIETLHNSIIDFQRKEIISKKDYSNLINRFTHYSIIYLKSNWVQIEDASPNRWETFFKFYNLPIKLLDGEIQSIDFNGRVFETYGHSPLCIYINKDNIEAIENLKKKGYYLLDYPEIDGQIPIGLDLKSHVLCPAIEYYFFIYKYIFYYHLFLLFYHSKEYIQKTFADVIFTKKEFNLYRIFEPVITSFFDIDVNRINDSLDFKFITYNSDELEIIYNMHLMTNAKLIEKKLYQYFLLRHSKKK